MYFKIKRSTQFRKLMDAYCEKMGKQPGSVRFTFDGERIGENQTPADVRVPAAFRTVAALRAGVADKVSGAPGRMCAVWSPQLNMEDNDTIEVFIMQVGGARA